MNNFIPPQQLVKGVSAPAAIMKEVAASLLLLSCLAVAVKGGWNNTITVNSTCLNDALNELYHNSTLLQFNDDVYWLKPGNGTIDDETRLQFKSDIAFVGSYATIIKCLDGGGLSFSWSTRITIRNITFQGCNMEVLSTSRNFSSSSFQFMTVRAALYFLFSSDVTLDAVTVDRSGGYGLILYNTIGSNSITNSFFTGNGGYPLPVGGGVVIEFSYCMPGNTDCPSKGSSLIESSLVSNAQYQISRNDFSDNTASPSSYVNLDPYPSSGRDYFGFGRGGGLSVVFKGNAQNNTVNLASNLFNYNAAQFGGGLYVLFDDDAMNNAVISSNDTISNGAALIPGLYQTFIPPLAEGGAAMFLYGSESNSISMSLTTISGNTASSFGGGLYVNSRVRRGQDPGKLTLDNVHTTMNIAPQGAGMFFINLYPQSMPIAVSLSNCIWDYNSVDAMCSYPSDTLCSGIVYTRMLPLVLSGNSTKFMHNSGSALDVHQTHITILSQVVTFNENTADNGPAIHLSNCGKVIVSHNIDLFFSGNTAYFSGGAIFETGCSLTSLSYTGVGAAQCFIQYLDSTVHPENWNTSFFFSDNIAGKERNSIYADSLLPCTWTSSDSPLLTQDDIKNTFCWKNWWHYGDGDPQCKEFIQSGPAYINITTSTLSSNKALSFAPGQSLLLPIKVYNNYDEEDPQEVRICLESGFGSFRTFSSDAPDCITAWTADPVPLIIYSHQTDINNKCDNFDGTSATISISTATRPYLKALVPITLKSCPLFAYFSCPQCYVTLGDDIGLKCVDTETCQITQSPCTLNSSLTTVSGYCWSATNTSKSDNALSLVTMVGGDCPYSYGQRLPCQRITDCSSYAPNLCPGNRDGRLCGRCASGYQMSSNTIDFRCIKCHGPGWRIQLAIEVFAVTILMVLIIGLSISLNAGGTNAFIFFAQAVSIKYPGLSYPSWVFEIDYSTSVKYNNTVVRGFTLLYSIANFEIITPLPLPPLCLSDDFTPIHAVLLDFIAAIYPLLLLALLYTWVIMNSYKVRPVVYVTKALTKLCHCFKVKYRLSLMDSFVTVAIICASRIIATCFKLLKPSFIYKMSGEWIGTAFYYDGSLDYFGDGHYAYASLALFVLLVLILIPSTLLLFSQCIQRSLERRHFHIERLKSLMGTFNSCFKDGQNGTFDLRFFAGLYIYLRVALRLMYMFHDAKVLLALEVVFSIVVAVIFITVRPYKNDIFNTIDAIIFLYLGLLAGLSACGWAWLCYEGLLYLPLLIVLLYGIFCLLRKCYIRFCAARWTHQYSLVPVIPEDDSSSDDEEDKQGLIPHLILGGSTDSNNTEDMFADRLMHPERYN